MKPEISVVIPVYNEQDILQECYERVSNILQLIQKKYEIIFVDDGSKGQSLSVLKNISHKDDHVKIILFSRNFGKEAALTAGIDFSVGDAIIILDADLQDPPELISKMIAVWRETNVDVVLMKRKSRRGETITKKITANLFYRIMNNVSPFYIPEDVGDFRLITRKAADVLKNFPERNRYMKGLFAWIGMDSYTLEYDRDSRIAGKTKMNYIKLINLAIEGITSFSIIPLRFAVLSGIIFAFFGFGFGAWIIFKTLIIGEIVKGYTSTIAIVTSLGGIQLFTIGIVGEYIGKIYLETKQRPNYIVKEIIINGQSQTMLS